MTRASNDLFRDKNGNKIVAVKGKIQSASSNLLTNNKTFLNYQKSKPQKDSTVLFMVNFLSNG